VGLGFECFLGTLFGADFLGFGVLGLAFLPLAGPFALSGRDFGAVAGRLGNEGFFAEAGLAERGRPNGLFATVRNSSSVCRPSEGF